MSFYVTGDTHGDIDINKLTTKRFDHKELTKNDYVLVCGDFGAVWNREGFDYYIQRWWHFKPWTTLFVDGNHENHYLLDNYPVTLWNGGNVHKISDSIIHLMRGQVFMIDGNKIFTMGGASSHDKEYRKENVSWWARELPSKEEYNEAIINLRRHDNKVDYIFTHCASSTTQSKIADWYDNDDLTSFLKIVEDIEFKKWFFGHYHSDLDLDEKHIALYNRIVKLW